MLMYVRRIQCRSHSLHLKSNFKHLVKTSLKNRCYLIINGDEELIYKLLTITFLKHILYKETLILGGNAIHVFKICYQFTTQHVVSNCVCQNADLPKGKMFEIILKLLWKSFCYEVWYKIVIFHHSLYFLKLSNFILINSRYF